MSGVYADTDSFKAVCRPGRIHIISVDTTLCLYDYAEYILNKGGEHMVKEIKTHHQPGYHKPVRNPTTNSASDKHKEFCKRCFARNGFRFCPEDPKTCDI